MISKTLMRLSVTALLATLAAADWICESQILRQSISLRRRLGNGGKKDVTDGVARSDDEPNPQQTWLNKWMAIMRLLKKLLNSEEYQMQREDLKTAARYCNDLQQIIEDANENGYHTPLSAALILYLGFLNSVFRDLNEGEVIGAFHRRWILKSITGWQLMIKNAVMSDLQRRERETSELPYSKSESMTKKDMTSEFKEISGRDGENPSYEPTDHEVERVLFESPTVIIGWEHAITGEVKEFGGDDADTVSLVLTNEMLRFCEEYLEFMLSLEENERCQRTIEHLRADIESLKEQVEDLQRTLLERNIDG